MSKTKGLLNNYLRILLFVAAFIVAVYLIARNIGVFGNILKVLLGFGAVVLIHELGHFVFAKLSDIKVEAFSIGFPPILVGILKTEEGYRVRILPGFLQAGENDESDGSLLTFTFGKKGKAGETEYRIGLIPFGGFVKMLGQEDTKATEKSNDPRSYANKPVGARMAVITAGVVFNVISAVVVFMIVFLIGINRMPAVIGEVIPNSPAERAGIRSGDEVIEIAGKRNNLEYSHIMMAAALSGRDEQVPLTVLHEDGTTEEIVVAAERTETTMGEIRLFGGVFPPESLTIAKLAGDDANDLFGKTGLKPGDQIKSVNGKDIQAHWQFMEVVSNTLQPAVTVLAERTDKSGNVELIESQIPLALLYTDTFEIESESDLCHIAGIVPRLRIVAVAGKSSSVKTVLVSLLKKIGLGKNDAGSKPSLQAGDIVLGIGDIENPTYQEMRNLTNEYDGKELPISVLRMDANGVAETLAISVVPGRSGGSDRVRIGIALELDTEHTIVAKTIPIEEGLERLEIPRGAMITAVDGVEVSNFYDIIRELRRCAGEQIMLDWRIDKEVAGDVALDLRPNRNYIRTTSILAESVPFKPLERLYKASGPVDAIVMGYQRTIMFVAQAYMTLQRLFTGLISPKSFMGPVGIVTFSYKIVSYQSFIDYAYFLGLISAFIAVFNFLPMLPFDGGHIVFLLIEKIKGSAVNERIQGAVTYVGLVIVGAFFLYVTFNDIARSLFS